MKLIYKKITVSGDVVRISEYEKPVKAHFGKRATVQKTAQKVTGKELKSEEKTKADCDHRARLKIQKIINSAFYLEREVNFLTLTYHRLQTDRQETYSNLQAFFGLMQEDLEVKIKYLAVTELQPKRGALHIHAIVNQYLPFDLILWTWRYVTNDDGGAWIVQADKSTNIGSYLTKYLTKSENTGRRKGERRYWKSRDCKDLSVTFECEKSDTLEELSKVLVNPYQCEYDSQYNGKIKLTIGKYNNPGEVCDIAYNYVINHG